MSSGLTLRLPETARVVFSQAVLHRTGLLQHAADVAARLRKVFGVTPGDRVGLMMVPGPEIIPSMLGIWMVGAAYVPLDPFLPDERLLRILRDADLRAVVTQRIHRITLDVLGAQLSASLPTLVADDPARAPLAPLDVSPEISASPEQPAYIIYTSGSTGEPKGVVCTFGGLSNLVMPLRERLGLSAQTRHLQFASINFDASVWEIFPTLFAGGTVVHGSREELLPGRRMAAYLRDQRVTHICLPPSVLGQLSAFVGTLPDVDCVVMAGERCPPPLAERWHTAGRRVFNAYGPTEATVCATLHRVQGGEEPMPIGEALPSVQLRIVSPDGRDCPPDTPGELWVGGAGVAAGYRNQPERTARSFPRDEQGRPWYRTGDEVVRRQDSSLHFLGRLDQQVKLRGFRIELEAIEQALYAFPAIAGAAVKAFEDMDAQGQSTGVLVAYYSPQEGQSVAREALRAHLASVLPDYMVPHHFVELTCLPLMPNLSKVDRQALPPPADWKRASTPQVPEAHSEEPATPLDRVLHAFESVMRFSRGDVSADTHFFQCGGDSLGVAQLLALLEEDFGVSLPSRLVYSQPTPAALLPFCLREQGALSDDIRGAASELLADSRRYTPPQEPTSRPRPSHPPRTVLLTGATGFLGVHLLATLAYRVDRVYCLVRARSDAEGAMRIQATAQRYGVELPWSGGRIHAVAGDITREALGLGAEIYGELARSCDAIVHSAANISYILPYTDAERPNVDGTRHILAFATRECLKAMHHVSSLSVYGAAGTLLGLSEVDEDFDLDRSLELVTYENGYTRAKWVAERIVSEARAAGLPVSIYRPGFIQGHSVTGIGNADDLLCRLWVGNMQMGMYPDFPRKYWLPVPVDYVAAAMTHIVLTQRPGGNYNLIPARHQEPSHNAMFERMRDLGHALRKVAPHIWLRELARVGPDNALFPLVGFLREKVYHGTRTVLELHHTTPEACANHAQAALADTDIRCPDIDSALLGRYLRHLLREQR